MAKVKFIQSLQRFGRWAKVFFWRRQSIYGALLIALLYAVIVQLSIIPSGSAPAELEAIAGASSISAIADNPLYLPYKLFIFLMQYLTDSVRFVRAVSITFFGLCVIALYRILKRWHSDKVALYAAGMFATSAVALTTARLAGPPIFLLGWTLLIALLLWFQHGNSKRLAPFMLAVIAAALVYVPGAPYFFLLLILVFFRKVQAGLRTVRTLNIVVCAVAAGAVLTPLIISFVQNPGVIAEWLLLPDAIKWGDLPRNILRVPSAFIYRAPVNPLLNVGRLPVFDVAAGGFFLIGLYAYQQNVKLERTKIMVITGLFSILLGALGALTAAILIALPFVYAVIAAGISYVLDQWYSVFPKNPFARSFGLLLITCVVLASVYYQLTRFLVVWPQMPQTREIYSESRLVQ